MMMMMVMVVVMMRFAGAMMVRIERAPLVAVMIRFLEPLAKMCVVRRHGFLS